MTNDEIELPCTGCGMPCTPGEYHPMAACWMFKACGHSRAVRVNLKAVQDDAIRADRKRAQAAEPVAIYQVRYLLRPGEEAQAWHDIPGEKRAELMAFAARLSAVESRPHYAFRTVYPAPARPAADSFVWRGKDGFVVSPGLTEEQAKEVSDHMNALNKVIVDLRAARPAVTDEMVERAAIAVFLRSNELNALSGTWDDEEEVYKEAWRSSCRRALEAALGGGDA